MLSHALKHSDIDLRGTSKHTKCRGSHERGEGKVAVHRTLSQAEITPLSGHTGAPLTETHTTLTCANTPINSDDSKISSQTQMTNICSV